MREDNTTSRPCENNIILEHKQVEQMDVFHPMGTLLFPILVSCILGYISLIFGTRIIYLISSKVYGQSTKQKFITLVFSCGIFYIFRYRILYHQNANSTVLGNNQNKKQRVHWFPYLLRLAVLSVIYFSCKVPRFLWCTRDYICASLLLSTHSSVCNPE